LSYNVKMAETVLIKKVRKPRAKKTNIVDTDGEEQVHVPKKRGRKPKGGKIVKKQINLEENSFDNQVIILHLKCKLNDLNESLFENINSQINYNTNIIKEVKAYSKDGNEAYYNLNKSQNEEVVYNVIDGVENKIIQENDVSEKVNIKEKQKNKKNIYTKLKELEILFNNNNNNINKKSDCFWCTCDFTTEPIFIPSLYHKGKYEVYGCFCSPECAASYLFKENIDTTPNLKDINF